MTTDELIGTTEASRLLDVDKTTLTRWVANGKLAAAHKMPKRNGAFLFRRSDVEALLTAEAAS